MSEAMQRVRGMRDILPEETVKWQRLEALTLALMARYGYGEIRTPVLEKLALFTRGIGEATDVVEKEMYAFEDRNGDMLALRPENTAGSVRAALNAGLAGVQRVWYMGPQFRHERPQRGRYRQFHQIGAEAWGMAGPEIEAELILLCAAFWRELGLAADEVQLEINTLGTPEDRAAHRTALIAYFREHLAELDEDATRRLDSNPLRILDTKNPAMQDLVIAAPRLSEYLCEASQQHFAQLQALLDAAGQPYVINHRLVRGLDYYRHCVFEWTTTRLGAQGTICGGGRYDGLVEQIGGKPNPGVGFAMGVERLLELAAERLDGAEPPHLYVVNAGEAAARNALRLSETIRQQLPHLRCVVDCSGTGLKSQFKRADKSGAALALVLAEQEAQTGQVGIKPLRGDGEQIVLAQDELIDDLRQRWSQ